MRSFEQYDEICKYFTEGKQRDNDANEIQIWRRSIIIKSKTNGGKQIEFSAESNQFEKTIKSGIK